MRRIKKMKLGGCSSMDEITISTVELYGDFETMVFHEQSDELEERHDKTEEEALKTFDSFVQKYAGELQKACYNANLKKGQKYTMVYCDEFGFPVAQRMTFEKMELTTYAQYHDVVHLTYRPYKARSIYSQYLYYKSYMIFEGWQTMKKDDHMDKVHEDSSMVMHRSKYGCFDSRYIEDAEKLFKNPVMIHKDYKVGKNGKVYA